MAVLDVKELHKWELLSKPNVVMVATGPKVAKGLPTGDDAIICSVVNKVPPTALSRLDRIPEMVEGIPTDVVEVGVLRADPPIPAAFDLGRTDKHRPTVCGISIGHYLITAGTLGFIAVDLETGALVIVSNNHVLANSNGAEKGDNVLQPGVHDGGSSPDDILGHLLRFVPITFEGSVPPTPCPIADRVASLINAAPRVLHKTTRLVPVQATANLVDAAIATPISDDMITPEILEIGTIAGVAAADIGMKVQKSGRTTGLTEDFITQMNATVRVQYGSNRVAVFEDQLVAGEMSQGGDSGSAVLDMNRNIVGLLFAGSDTTTIVNPIQDVLELLNIDVYYG